MMLYIFLRISIIINFKKSITSIKFSDRTLDRCQQIHYSGLLSLMLAILSSTDLPILFLVILDHKTHE